MRHRTDLITNFFVYRFVKRLDESIKTIPHNTLQALKNYRWPGNVRELKNVIGRSVIISPDPRLLVDLLRPQHTPADEIRTIEEIERNHMLKVFRETHWKIEGLSEAARPWGSIPLHSVPA